MQKKCYCMNNEKDCSEDIFESKCDSVISYSDTNYNICGCGFDEECLVKVMFLYNIWIKHLNLVLV